MDLHKLQEVAPEALANAHLKDLDVQDKYGVSVICVTGSTSRTGKIFSFAKAPTADVAIAVHREAHRLLPDEIIEVQGKDVVGFLGTAEEVPRGQNAASQHGFQSVIFQTSKSQPSTTAGYDHGYKRNGDGGGDLRYRGAGPSRQAETNVRRFSRDFTKDSYGRKMTGTEADPTECARR